MDVLQNSFIAGSCQTIIGHPFDTIKTLKQVYPQSSTLNLLKNNHGFYKGYFPALIGGCLQNSFIFSTEKYFEKNFSPITSGFISGTITSLIISPMELIKSNQQIKRKWKIKDLTRGLGLCILRDSIGFSIYFGSYHYLQNKNNNPLLNGGIAGTLSWTYSYPFDTIKTKKQTSNKSIKEIIKNTKFLSGINIMLFRAFVVNAGIFYVFEHLS